MDHVSQQWNELLIVREIDAHGLFTLVLLEVTK